MTSTRAKTVAQVAGLGVGCLRLEKVRQHLAQGTLLALATQGPRRHSNVGSTSCSTRDWYHRCST